MQQKLFQFIITHQQKDCVHRNYRYININR